MKWLDDKIAELAAKLDANLAGGENDDFLLGAYDLAIKLKEQLEDAEKVILEQDGERVRMHLPCGDNLTISVDLVATPVAGRLLAPWMLEHLKGASRREMVLL